MARKEVNSMRIDARQLKSRKYMRFSGRKSQKTKLATQVHVEAAQVAETRNFFASDHDAAAEWQNCAPGCEDVQWLSLDDLQAARCKMPSSNRRRMSSLSTKSTLPSCEEGNEEEEDIDVYQNAPMKVDVNDSLYVRPEVEARIALSGAPPGLQAEECRRLPMSTSLYQPDTMAASLALHSLICNSWSELSSSSFSTPTVVRSGHDASNFGSARHDFPTYIFSFAEMPM